MFLEREREREREREKAEVEEKVLRWQFLCPEGHVKNLEYCRVKIELEKYLFA